MANLLSFLLIHKGLLDKLRDEKSWYKFSHDKIKEAALALVPRGTKIQKDLHLEIGRQLRNVLNATIFGPAATKEEQQMWENRMDPSDPHHCRLLFLSVHHLNFGSERMSDQQERVQLAGLNLQAARVVLEKSAFRWALRFLEKGLCLLEGKNKWKENYDLMLEISTKLTHARFCCGSSAEDLRKFMKANVLKHAKTMEDKLGVYRTLILTYIAQGDFVASADICRAVLKKLGIKIPQKFLAFHIVRAMKRVEKLIKDRTDEDFLTDFPINAEEIDSQILYVDQCDFLGLYVMSHVFADSSDRKVLGMLYQQAIMLTHRVEDVSSVALAGIGWMHCRMGKMDTAYRFCRLAAAKASEAKFPNHDCRALAMAYDVIPWREPYHNCLQPLEQAYKMALRHGAIEEMYLPMVNYSLVYFHCGLRLEHLKKDMLRLVEIFGDFELTSHVALLRPTLQLVLDLMGLSDTEKLTRLSGDDYSTRALMEEPGQGDKQALQHYYRQRMIFAYYMGDIGLAEEMSSKLKPPNMRDVTAFWLAPRIFYEGLIAFAMCRSGDKSRRKKYIVRGQKCLQMLEQFVADGNVNCPHMALILQAEHMGLGALQGRGGGPTAQIFYDNAIIAAGKSGFIHEQALANELAAGYFLRRGDTEDNRAWASTYLDRAYDLFQQWGARAKTMQMESSYTGLLEDSLVSPMIPQPTLVRAGTGHYARSRVSTPRMEIKKRLSWLAFRESNEASNHSY